MSETLQQTIASTQSTLFGGTGGLQVAAPAAQGDAWSLYEAKKAREAAVAKEDTLQAGPNGTYWGGYTGAMWRQDSPVDGLVATAIGHTYAPDPQYTPYAPAEWDRLTAGLPEQFHNEFLGATSAEHANFIRGRLSQKVADITNLGDLGKVGTAGRLLFGLVEPVSALAGIATFGVGKALSVTGTAAKALGAANAAGDLVAASAATKALAAAAKLEGGVLPTVGGAVAGGALNAGITKLTQSVNFEDDSIAVLEAGLIGTVMSAPFAYLGSKQMLKMQNTAHVEHQVLQIAIKHKEGIPLTAADHAVLNLHDVKLKEVREAEMGLSSPLHDEVTPPTPAELAAKAAADVKRSADYEKALAVLDEQKQAELKALWEDSKLTAGDAQERVQRILDVANADTKGAPNAMQLAFEAAQKAKAEREAGFEPKTAGFEKGSVGSAQGTPIAPGEDRTVMASARYDYYSRLNKQENPHFQTLAYSMVKDAIGNSPFYAQGRSASEVKSLIRRSAGGSFHKTARDSFFEAAKSRNLGWRERGKFETEFYSDISKMTRDAQAHADIIAANPDIAAQLTKASAAMSSVYKKLADMAKKSGVEGAENLQANGHYVNRVWDHNNIRKVYKRLEEIYGKGNAQAEFDRIIAAASPPLRNDPVKARNFMSAVKALEHKSTMQDILLAGRDMGVLRRELADAGLRPAQIDALVDTMFEVKAVGKEADAGNPTNLKHRLDMDEAYHETLADGSEFHVSSLWENDSRMLVDKYINSMAGHIGMAQKGITSRAEFQKRMRAADEFHTEHLQMKQDGQEHKTNTQMVQDLYDNITGRPMSTQTFNTGDRILGSFRAYTRSTMLGQLGIAAAFEMKNSIGMTGIHAFAQQSGGFRGLIEMMRTGRIPNKDLAQGIEQWSGFGLERAAAYSRLHEINEFSTGVNLTRFENFANQSSHMVDTISGNAFFTSATRQLSAASFIQKHYNMAGSAKRLGPAVDPKTGLPSKQRQRLVNQGIDADEIDNVLQHLKDYSTVDSKGTVKNVDWEKWHDENPLSYDSYTLAVERETRTAIQDHDIGETLPFMHTTVGKIFGELRTFNIAGHAKQTLNGVHFRDQQAAQTFMISLVGEAMAYALQTSINFAHNPAELEKRLTWDRIGKSAVSRMSMAGIMPMLLESGYYVGTGGDSLLGGGSTTNTDNRKVFITPSMIAAARLAKGASVLTGAVNPLSRNIVTNQDMRDLMGTLPGGNTWGMRNINDYISSGFPKKEVAAPK